MEAKTFTTLVLRIFICKTFVRLGKHIMKMITDVVDHLLPLMFFLLEFTALFLAESKYLNTENLESTSTCPNNYCRLPDAHDKRAFCLFKYWDNNMGSCPSKKTDSTYDKYYSSFKCPSGYTRVYYECIEDSLVVDSAMYFNSLYSFPNLLYDLTSSVSDNTEYGIVAGDDKFCLII